MNATKIIFSSKKDPLFFLFILCFLAFSLFLLFKLDSNFLNSETLAPFIIVVSSNLLLFWLFFGTFYIIKNNHIHFRSGPFFGKISCQNIRKIVSGKTLWVGYRPATARKGLIIYYNKFDEIYFSPKNQTEFIELLTQLNPNIIVEST